MPEEPVLKESSTVKWWISVVLSAGSNAGFKDVFFGCCLASLYVCSSLPGLPNHQSGVHDIKKLLFTTTIYYPESVFAKHGRSFFLVNGGFRHRQSIKSPLWTN